MWCGSTMYLNVLSDMILLCMMTTEDSHAIQHIECNFVLQVPVDFIARKPKKESAVEIILDRASSKDSKMQFMKGANATHEKDMFSKLRRAGEGSGIPTPHKKLSFASKEIDEIQLVEESNGGKYDPVTIEDDHEWRFNKHNLQSKSSKSIAKPSTSTHGTQGPNNSLYGNSVSESHLIKGTLSTIQSRRNLQKTTSIASSSVKENGHRTDPQPSSSKSNDVVALPSTSGTVMGTQDKLCAIPLLNAQGSYFQIGPAGQPDEQMFEYSVTIVFAKFLDQVSFVLLSLVFYTIIS